MDLNKYYLEKLGAKEEVIIWLVNGNLIRKEVDIEFANFGQHYRFSFIPENEFWLDVEAVLNERPFFIEHLFIEWRLMKKGISYETALASANEAETYERKKKEGYKKILGSEGTIIIEKIHKELLGQTEDNISVWLVDGRIVRNNLNIDFSEGGHDLVYDFIPEKEVWIDDDVVKEERIYIILHELYERLLMKNGYSYSHSHGGVGETKGASEIEWEARNNDAKLKKYLELLEYKS